MQIVTLVSIAFSCTMGIVDMYVHKKPTQTKIHQYVKLAIQNVSSVLDLQSIIAQVVRLAWSSIILLVALPVRQVIQLINGMYV